MIEGSELPKELDDEMMRIRELTNAARQTLHEVLQWHSDRASVLGQENEIMWHKIRDHFGISDKDINKWYARWDRDSGHFLMRERADDNPYKEPK